MAIFATFLKPINIIEGDLTMAKSQNSRRRFLKISALGVGGIIVTERSFDYFSESKANGKIVIVGGGAAGITMAAYLTDKLRNPDITIIEPNEIHHYQPGYTMIAGGVFTADEVTKPNIDLIPRGVTWVKDKVVELNPESNCLDTQKSGKICYDYLVLVPGCQMNFSLVEGIDEKRLGEGNVHSIYTYDGAQKCFEALKKMPDLKDGNLVFTDTYTKFKCGGAPKKICLMAENYLRDHDARNDKSFNYYSNSTNLMTPKIFGDRLAEIFAERNVQSHFNHRLVAVDTASQKATFELLPKPSLDATPIDANYEKVEVDFDFLHIVPPMFAPDFVKNSPVAITGGELQSGGWVDVDKSTLIHNKYPNIVSFGDVAGLPTSKTGAAIRMQAPVAAANLVALMEGKQPTGSYNGYSGCPIVTEYGKVLMAEFGYEKELMPTIPFIDPDVERGMWWILKKHGLKPMYYHGMLKGLM
jgi:sulfide:quinone oxidoreductase